MDDAPDHETAARLRRAVTRLNRRLRASSLGGVSPAQASMLSSVESLDSPTLGDLATAEQIQPPSVTRLVQSLEEAGLVVCSPDPDDRRSTRVRVTASGRRELTQIRHRKTEFLERTLQALSEADRRRAGELVVLLERLVDQP
ncbi:MAG: winged helix-turn-helix transcriptional regulator [Acidobacteriota bacterium]|nr:winged helix-turn-helix transcriptional regulator [Acidobacteriota bacterium]